MRPRWNDPNLKIGSMVRVALWLLDEVGVGNNFTKDRLRQSFSGIAQVDRRLRDLRKFGWVIQTNRENAGLKSNEQCFSKMGVAVWEPGKRRVLPTTLVTAKMRAKTLSESNYQCSLCGISGGDVYPEPPKVAAVLTVSIRPVVHADGKEGEFLQSECERCRSGASARAIDLSFMKKIIMDFDEIDRAVFTKWAISGKQGRLAQIWSEFKHLPTSLKTEILDYIKSI